MPDTNTMSLTNVTTGFGPYSNIVAKGLYNRHLGGLSGKHDNVRTYWEDHVTRIALRPFVNQITRACHAEKRGVRILDLGCGAGQGYELLTSIHQKDLHIDGGLRYVLSAEQVDQFIGVDISDAMVEQGRRNLSGVPNVAFEQADLSEGLGDLRSESPFDIYFSSYGSLSHLETCALRRCLTDIFHHARPGALVVLDLLGRYSPEWPLYWSRDGEGEDMHPYSMSYMYDEHERHNCEIEQFPLRFWSGTEVLDLCTGLEHQGVCVKPVKLLDRSIFVGRHIDTREYQCSVPPLRSLVNRLYELNVRTDVERLRLDYQPSDGSEELNRFFGELAMSWTKVIDFTLNRIQRNRKDLVVVDGWGAFPHALQRALMTMDRVIDSVSWMISLCDVRANILEPQLACVLQRLECTMQRGWGCGHGLIVVLQVG